MGREKQIKLNQLMIKKCTIHSFLVIMIFITSVTAGGGGGVPKSSPANENFYKKPSLFSSRPSSPTDLIQSIDRFGPVGIGIELYAPAFVMKIKNVEEGSPAANTGKLMIEAGITMAPAPPGA
jgi:hypothetical protein